MAQDCFAGEGSFSPIEIIEPDLLKSLAEFATSDKDGLLATMIRSRMEESGLLAALGLCYVPPLERHSEFPVDWTCYQIGIFDNGNQLDKRQRERKTRTRYALDIKIWTGEAPVFKNGPAFQVSCPLWTRTFATKHVESLARRGSLQTDDAEGCLQVLGAIDDEWLFGVPIKRGGGAGTKYMSGHFAALKVDIDQPRRLMVYANGAHFSTGEFVRTDPKGEPLVGNVVAAVRMTRGISLPYWESDHLDE